MTAQDPEAPDVLADDQAVGSIEPTPTDQTEGEPTAAEPAVSPAPGPPEPTTIGPRDWEARLAGLEREVRAVRAAVDELRGLTGQVVEMQQLAAEQLRRQGRRVEQASSALADGRWRDLVTGLLLYDDLLAGLDQGRVASGGLDILRSQLRQLLRGHGIEAVATDGPADFRVHRAVRKVEVDDPSRDGVILEVWRAGYRHGDVLLRPADVVVGVFRAPVEPSPPVEADPVLPSNPGAT